MALLLTIDTAVETASVCLAQDEKLLSFEINTSSRDHAAWIQPAIKKMMEHSRRKFSELDAIAVSVGPGSYTGLRIGLSTAKGLCYALGVPLIAIGTLDMMAFAAARQYSHQQLLCPMIDARRMEVFTAVFNQKLDKIVSPMALIIDGGTFSSMLETEKILFFGNGAHKFSLLCKHPNALFAPIAADASHLVSLSLAAFAEKRFADTAYCEPLYLKEFYSAIPKPLI